VIFGLGEISTFLPSLAYPGAQASRAGKFRQLGRELIANQFEQMCQVHKLIVAYPVGKPV